jgi:hypothetical protein
MGSAAAPAARVGALADPPGASPSPSASEFAARNDVSGEGAGHGTRGRVRSPFRDEWLALRARHPEVFTVSADEIDAWHRHEAWRGESRKDWSNAVVHLSALLETHPDSGDFLPRRAAAQVEWAESLMAVALKTNVVKTSSITVTTPQVKAVLNPPEPRGLPLEEQRRMSRAATNLLEQALADYSRTLAWVDRFPAIARESRGPFVEMRREVYLKLGRKAEAEVDERELKAAATVPTQR